jgi:hypothetical protein
MAPTLSKKNQNPFKPDQVVRATRTFAWEGGVVHKGEKYRGSDPAVVEGWNAFVDGDTLDQELENPWDTLPEPPQHTPEVTVAANTIPPHRQVRCMVDASVPVQWAPDSPGSGSGTPPPFLRSQLRSGQILDVLSDVVSKNPSWFRWIERDVSPEDIERMEKLQRLEREGDQAVR